MKTIKFIPLLLFAWLLAACGREEEEKPLPLQGTEWKLAGTVDTQTGVLTELAPTDCENCYTLTFDTDSTATGESVMNIIHVNIHRAPFFGVMTKIGDNHIGDVELFYTAIKSICSYELEAAGLKFFYNDSKNYLFYNRIGL